MTPSLRRLHLSAFLVSALMFGLGLTANAQQPKPPAQRAPAPSPAAPGPAAPNQAAPNQIGGNGPIMIDADRLEVLDKEKKAIFSGNVVATRGDMTVRSSVMTVFYDADLANGQAKPAPAPGANSNQSVRKIEMTGKVFFSQRDQQATGDNAVYERASETLVLTGDVVLTQCQNVVTGPRLVVNLRTNQAQVEGAPGTRVRSIIVPGDNSQPANAAPGCQQPPPQPPKTAPAAEKPAANKRKS